MALGRGIRDGGQSQSRKRAGSDGPGKRQRTIANVFCNRVRTMSCDDLFNSRDGWEQASRFIFLSGHGPWNRLIQRCRGKGQQRTVPGPDAGGPAWFVGRLLRLSAGPSVLRFER